MSGSTSRRRFQFRLRTLFVIFTVVAVILATRQLTMEPQGDVPAGRPGEMATYTERWPVIAMLTDVAVVGFAIWFTRRTR